jgi:hypothetical protein
MGVKRMFRNNKIFNNKSKKKVKKNIPTIAIDHNNEKAFAERLDKENPSTEPSYWAKKSCKKCYGRGIEGTITTSSRGGNSFKRQLICSCVNKSHQKWRKQKLEEYAKEEEEKKVLGIKEEKAKESVQEVEESPEVAAPAA